MATYWKSQPKKHCDFCHCWIADNKASIDFHERGKRHQENVEKKLKELRKKGHEQYKMQQSLDEDLIKMETEALKAFKKDLANDPALAAEYRAKAAAASASTAAAMKKEELLNSARKLHKQGLAATKSTSSAKAVTPSVTASSASSSASPATTASSPAASASNDVGKHQGAAQCVWLEGTSPEGHTYYWNTVTGESQWEQPEGYVATEESTMYRSEVTVQQGQRSQVKHLSQKAQGTTEEKEEKLGIKQTKVPEKLVPPGCEDEQPVASDDKDEDTKEVGEQESKGREEENAQRATKRKLGNPYGGWTTVIPDDTPPVDFQLPQSDRPIFQPVIPQAAQHEPREKITFKERTVSSLNMSKTASSSSSLGSGEASFKKRKFGGAGRSIRQRDADT